ncbi:MAG TPA: tyrosine-type recombinase/integrase, partial [Acidimicrobiales bacterium]|nr:tyrosine-type recombinase/integrase [Acidimicrobiales bacterium]
VGKGRKERATPLTDNTVTVLRAWLTERRPAQDEPLFVTTTGRPLSRYGINAILDRHLRTAAAACPSLSTKTITAHALRHSAAMRLLHARVDATVIALWLGHESVETTQVYVHADLTLKERAIARTRPVGSKPGRYRPSDDLLAFLESL